MIIDTQANEKEFGTDMNVTTKVAAKLVSMKYKTLILRIIIVSLVIATILSIKTALASSQTVTELIKSTEKVEVINLRTLPIKEYAKYHINDEFGVSQWGYFDELVMRESSWRNTAQNPNSTAFGLGQFLNGTWETVGCVKTKDAHIQIDCMIKYVDTRYGSPEKALDFHTLNNYY